MERLEAVAAGLRGRLGGVKLRDLARCDAAAAAAAEVEAAATGADMAAADGAGAGTLAAGDGPAVADTEPPAKKRRLQ
jgi:hypothetical protein